MICNDCLNNLSQAEYYACHVFQMQSHDICEDVGDKYTCYDKYACMTYNICWDHLILAWL